MARIVIYYFCKQWEIAMARNMLYEADWKQYGLPQGRWLVQNHDVLMFSTSLSSLVFRLSLDCYWWT